MLKYLPLIGHFCQYLTCREVDAKLDIFSMVRESAKLGVFVSVLNNE